MRIGFGLDVARLNIDESVTGLWSFTNPAGIRVDDINEVTPALGVLVDGVLLKDGGVELGGQLLLSSANVALGAGDNNDVVIGDVVVVTFNTSAIAAITGLAGGVDKRTICLMRIGVHTTTLKHQDVNSAVSNRLLLPGSADITLGTNESVWLWYDGTFTKWRVMGSG